MKEKKFKVPKIVMADNPGKKRYYKKLKNKAERRNAKKDPECPQSYGKYKGWAS